MDGALLRAVRVILQLLLIFLFLLLFGLPSVRRYQEKQVRVETSKSETGGIDAPSITVIALDNTTRNGWWVALPGNPDTFQFVEPQCGAAEDIAACKRRRLTTSRRSSRTSSLGSQLKLLWPAKNFGARTLRTPSTEWDTLSIWRLS